MKNIFKMKHFLFKSSLFFIVLFTCVTLFSHSSAQVKETAVYVNKDPYFTIEYPKDWVQGPQYPDTVLSVISPNQIPSLSVSVIKLDSKWILKDAPEGWVQIIKTVFPKTTQHEILSQKIITLDDSTEAIAARISWTWEDGNTNLVTSFLAANKGNKRITAASTGVREMPYEIIESITNSLSFKQAKLNASLTTPQPQAEVRYTYYESDGIFVYYQTKDIDLYRKVLPKVFDMPEEPLVMAFFIDYYKMDKATQPYQEAAIFLLVKYEGKLAWHCITMPVTTDEARLGGVYFLGYPKIMGDVILQRNQISYNGSLKLGGKTILTISHDTKDHVITKEEENWFQKLKGIPSLTILQGKIFRPKISLQDNGQYSALDISKMFPGQFQIKVGKSKLFIDPKAAAEYDKELADVYKIKPSNIVLAYYLKNKFKYNFVN